MNSWTWAALIFAQNPAPAGGANGNPLGPYLQFLPFLVIGLLFYMMLIRPQQREQQKRQDLLKALKKNDRVVTIGGIIGTIANLTSDGQEVTLKVDDNTRLRLRRSAIQEVLSAEAPASE